MMSTPLIQLLSKLKDGNVSDETAKEAIDEIERLVEKANRQATILQSLTPERHPDILFITGVSGNKDSNNMPEKLLVCPAYGCDFSYVYERTEKTVGPEW